LASQPQKVSAELSEAAQGNDLEGHEERSTVESRQSTAQAKARKSSSDNSSARACGPFPMAPRATSQFARGASDASALASVFRRDRNPREARRSAAARRRGSSGCSRGESSSTLETTFGRGRKAPGGKSKRTWTRPNAAVRTDR